VTPAELTSEVRRRLAAEADPAFREGAQRFFRGPLEVYGVRAPVVKALARAIFPAVNEWPHAVRDRFAAGLWKSGFVEEAGVVIYVYQRLARHFGVREFHLFERWVDRYVNNWASCDGVACWLLSAVIAHEPALIDELPAWTQSPNRWKRRAAIVSLIQEAKRGRHTDAIFDIAGRLIGDEDDLVRKGLGWVLKVAYGARPQQVVRFLRRGTGVPRLVLRLAAEKMSAADRAAVLGRSTAASA
jgi:3-methyladenine DNA glycosylase AlkD